MIMMPAATAEPQSRLSLGILALIVAVAVFSGVVAFLAFDRFGDDLMKKWVGESKPTKVVAPAPKPVDPPPPVEVEEPEVEEAAAQDGLTEEEGAEEKAKNSDETSEEEVKVPTRPLTGK